MNQFGVNQKKNRTLERQTAELLVRRFWVAFNNFTLYGEFHPLTDDAALVFDSYLVDALDDVTPITIHIEEDAFYCEEWRIGTEKFASRLVARCKDAKIQSISFHRGLAQGSALVFIKCLGDVKNFRSVDEISAELSDNGISDIQLNYVTYKKVTKDDVIVRKDVNELASMVETPSKVDAEKIVSAIGTGMQSFDGETAPSMVERLKLLGNRILGKGQGEEESYAVNKVIESFSHLRAKVVDHIENNQELGSEERDEALTELDKMTFDTIGRIVADEIEKDSFSVKRLATLIRRLIPGVTDLKRLLPKLKSVILGAGLSMETYAELVKELAIELEEEGIIPLLKDSAERIGLSVGEVVDTFRQYPDAAVRLLVLSAEIGSQIGLDHDRHLVLLKEYIERVTTHVTEDNVPFDPATQQVEIDSKLDKLEEELLEQFLEKGEQAPLKGQFILRPKTESRQERALHLINIAMGDLLGEQYDTLKEQLHENIDELSDSIAHSETGTLVAVNSGVMDASIFELEQRVLSLLDGEGISTQRIGDIQSRLSASLINVQKKLAGEEILVEEMISDVQDELTLDFKSLQSAVDALSVLAPADDPFAREALDVTEAIKTILALYDALRGQIENSDLKLDKKEKIITSLLPKIEDLCGRMGFSDTIIEEFKKEAQSRVNSSGPNLVTGEAADESGDARTDIGDRDLRDNIVPGQTGSEEEKNPEAGVSSNGKEKKKSKRAILPKGIVRVVETRNIIKREVSRCQRYKCAVTLLSFSFFIKTSENISREPDTEELAYILDEVYCVLRHLLRDLDIVGALGSLRDNYFVIVCSMTDIAGARNLLSRIKRPLGSIDFSLYSGEKPRIIMSVLSFDAENHSDGAAFIRAARAQHRKSIRNDTA